MLHPACLISSGIVFVLLSSSGAAGQAFTATVLHRYYGSETSQPPIVEVDLVAHRGDGSMAEVKQLMDGKIIGNKSILDLPGRKRIAVQIAGNSITTYRLPAKSVAHYRIPKTCKEGTPAGRLLGFEVVKVTRSARAESAGRIVRSQEWEAPALGCFTLKAEDDLYVDGAEKPSAITTTEVAGVTMGEPAADLFAIPPGFTERSPSKAISEAAKVNGRPCTQCALNTAGKLDQAYSHSQAR